MTTALDISNVALSLIGQNVTIASINPPEQSVEAEKCALFWPGVRDQILAAHTWSFAIERQSLALLGVTPPAPFQYAYAYPGDCIRFIGVRNPSATDDLVNDDCRLGSEDGARAIYTNTENAVGVFIKRQSEATLYGPSMVVAAQHLMASRLAGPIIQGVPGMQVAKEMLQLYIEFLTIAKREDAAQSRLRNTGDNDKYKAGQLAARGANGVTETPIIRG